MTFKPLSRIATVATLVLAVARISIAQATFPLWNGPAPGALGTAEKDIPTLTVFLPDSGKSTGAAMVICPGGGYSHLAAKEGEDYARFFGKHGISSFVLKYRLGSDGYRYPAIFEDVARALRLVRSEASKWGINPEEVGIIGSSAGGHLAATLLTHYDAGNAKSADLVERVSSRPDFGVLCYPVISMGAITHQGSKQNLLGENPSQELVDLLSNEKRVTPNTPPCFIWQTSEDKTVSVENSLVFADALAKNKVPFELHIYEKGRHGLGLGDKYPFTHALPWTEELLRWLRLRDFVKE